MSVVFLKLLNLSITASWLILAVILVRFLLKKAPKWISCVLWALVAIRLICPFSLESALSLIPSSETIPSNIEMMQKPAIDSGITAINEAVNPAITHSFAPDPMTSANPLQIVIPVLSIVWIVGMAAMLLYALISYIRLKKSVGASVPVRDNILACDEVKSPFILGIIKPLIYVPSSMEGETLDYVITHESAHIQRRDHWWKPFGFLLLAVYWFNPLCWIAYVLLCRDIEMACDEKVIRELDNNDKAAYSQALLNCSFPRRRIAACPLAFGEVGVKERVKSVLNYKKPAFWIIIVALVACIVVAVCFLTNPKDNEPDMSFLNYENACSTVADMTDVDTIFYPPTNKNGDGKISIGYVNGGELVKYLDLVSWQKWNAPQEGLSSPGSIEFCIRDDYRITVYQKPRWAVVTYGNEVRYYKTHAGDYDDAVKLFYTYDIRNAQTKEIWSERDLSNMFNDWNSASGYDQLEYVDSVLISDKASRLVGAVLAEMKHEARVKIVFFDEEGTAHCCGTIAKVADEPEFSYMGDGTVTFKLKTEDRIIYDYYLNISIDDGNVTYRAEDNLTEQINEQTGVSAGAGLPSDTENLILIRSSGPTIHPFLSFAYSETWTENGFLCVDGGLVLNELTEWSEATYLPMLNYSADFSVSYADGVDFRSILVFDEALNQLDDLYNVSALGNLKPGRYYISIVINQWGNYIEQAKQSEVTGWNCIFRMTVE